MLVALDQLDRRLGGVDLLVEHRGLLEERDEVVAVVGAQRRRPALVLLEQPREALPARLGELELLGVAVEDLSFSNLSQSRISSSSESFSM